MSAHIALDPAIFRTYDIRGIVGKTLTADGMVLLGKAIGSLALERGESSIAIARDGRLSGPLLFKALTEGILTTGCNVIDLGMLPTPLLYYATHLLPTNAGVMLTGSHNPAEYNGLKIVMQKMSLSEAEIQLLRERITAQQFSQGTGLYQQSSTILEQYIQEITSHVRLARPLNIVIDTGNGVAGMSAPALFHALACRVHTLFAEIDGRFPHHHPDPSQPENLQALITAVREKNADIGLAFDGDGDRLGVVTNEGEIIWPDRLLMLFANSLIKEYAYAKQPPPKIIFDVKCSNQLSRLIHSQGGTPIMWKTGHSLIKAKLAESNAQLAGEMSGHFFFKDRWYGFDDALYAGARLLEILSHHCLSSSAVFAAIPNSVNTPELKVPIAEDKKFTLMQRLIDGANFATAEEVVTIDGLRVTFSDGWGLVRPSNTTPYLILRFEATTTSALKQIQTLFRDWMLSVQPDLTLSF